MEHWRGAVNGMLELAEEDEGGDPNADLEQMPASERKEAGRAAFLRAYDALWLGSGEQGVASQEGDDDNDDDDDE